MSDVSTWNYINQRAADAARDLADARWTARVVQKLREKRRQREAADAVSRVKPPPSASAPTPWRPAVGPCSDAELERRARGLFDLAFHGIPWPAGWRVVWGELHAPNPLATRLACCYRDARTIVVNPAWLRPDAVDEFEETLVHELCHVLHPRGAHGAAFEETLDRALKYLAIPLTAPPVARPARRLEHPEPVKGARPYRGGWQRQPWLDPTLEYRG